jgi:hypothetical protein
MKKIFLFPIIFCVYIIGYSQNGCSDAQSHIFYAFNNAKDGLESNNVIDVKYYANKTLESFKSVQRVLGTCDCENVENYTYESIQKLSKVPNTVKMTDAKYFVAKAKDYAQKIITSLDYCTVSDRSTTPVSNTDELSDLENEQLRLKQQQESLFRKQEALKQQLAKQKKEELMMEKQQLILKNNVAIAKNIEAYNELLDACNCNTAISDKTIKQADDQLISKSVDEIKSYYIKSIKDITSNYLNMLSTCDHAD